jgi:hypothetical protein
VKLPVYAAPAVEPTLETGLFRRAGGAPT